MINNKLDFIIPKKCKGLVLKIKSTKIPIPKNAYFLDINPIEFEEEHDGVQFNCETMQLNYYDKEGKYLKTQDVSGIRVLEVRSYLEKVLIINY